MLETAGENHAARWLFDIFGLGSCLNYFAHFYGKSTHEWEAEKKINNYKQTKKKLQTSPDPVQLNLDEITFNVKTSWGKW